MLRIKDSYKCQYKNVGKSGTRVTIHSQYYFAITHRYILHENFSISARYKKKDYKGLFDEIYDGPLFIAEKVLLSHEPVYGLPWCLNIHGHDHSNMKAYREGCKHLNLAANVCDYMPVSLGKLIKDGILSDIQGIHRMTIDRASEKKE